MRAYIPSCRHRPFVTRYGPTRITTRFLSARSGSLHRCQFSHLPFGRANIAKKRVKLMMKAAGNLYFHSRMQCCSGIIAARKMSTFLP